MIWNYELYLDHEKQRAAFIFQPIESRSEDIRLRRVTYDQEINNGQVLQALV